MSGCQLCQSPAVYQKHWLSKNFQSSPRTIGWTVRGSICCCLSALGMGVLILIAVEIRNFLTLASGGRPLAGIPD